MFVERLGFKNMVNLLNIFAEGEKDCIIDNTEISRFQEGGYIHLRMKEGRGMFMISFRIYDFYLEFWEEGKVNKKTINEKYRTYMQQIFGEEYKQVLNEYLKDKNYKRM